eukprot:10095025-Karenia_brevis.AAC.1
MGVQGASAGSWGGKWHFALVHLMFMTTIAFKAPRSGDASDPFTSRDIMQSMHMPNFVTPLNHDSVGFTGTTIIVM